nr:MAG TPA: hypothetical protein [Caudoviricetes sp.]
MTAGLVSTATEQIYSSCLKKIITGLVSTALADAYSVSGSVTSLCF